MTYDKESEYNSGDVYVDEIWRWMQWDYSRDSTQSIAWKLSDSHKKWRQKFVEIQWYLNHISSSDDNEEVESKRHTSLDILIILNMFLPDYVNDKS